MAVLWGDQDATYLRGLEAERISLTGPTCQYYSLNKGVNVDPLYGEPTDDALYGGSGTTEVWDFADAIEFQVAIEYQEQDDRNPTVRDEGEEIEWDAVVRVARDTWECAWEDIDSTRLPKEGDVLYVFSQWFDVIKSGSGGNIVDTTTHVGFTLTLKKRNKFVPDRKIV